MQTSRDNTYIESIISEMRQAKLTAEEQNIDLSKHVFHVSKSICKALTESGIYEIDGIPITEIT